MGSEVKREENREVECMLIYDAVLARDYPLLQSCFLVIKICVLVAIFLADDMYEVLDPRVRGGVKCKMQSVKCKGQKETCKNSFS